MPGCRWMQGLTLRALTEDEIKNPGNGFRFGGARFQQFGRMFLGVINRYRKEKGESYSDLWMNPVMNSVKKAGPSVLPSEDPICTHSQSVAVQGTQDEWGFDDYDDDIFAQIDTNGLAAKQQPYSRPAAASAPDIRPPIVNMEDSDDEFFGMWHDIYFACFG